MVIPLLSLMIGVAGCGGDTGRGGGSHPAKKQTRPIAVTLLQKKNSNVCEAKFSNRPQHAFNDDEIAWEITNACPDDQTVTVAVKSESTNPFTDHAGSWTLSAIKNGDMGAQVLTVGAKGTVPIGLYKFDIIVGGKSYDPKLEIDP